MNQNLTKQIPVRVEDREYQELRERVLRRDGWRCQFCGSITNSKSTINDFAAILVLTTKTISLPSAQIVIQESIFASAPDSETPRFSTSLI